jgi:hypothetical protein
VNESNLVHRISYLTPGDGYRKSYPIFLLGTVRTAAGLVLDTATTVPAVTALESNFYGLSVATGQTFAGKFTWVVPADYDAAADELRIRVACHMAGATNSGETLTATIYRKRPIPSIIPDSASSFPAGLALSADLGAPTSVDTIPASATPNALTKWVEINADAMKTTIDGSLSGTANRSLAATADASIKPGDILQISLALSAAHATDACYIYGIEIWYRSNLAFSDINSR